MPARRSLVLGFAFAAFAADGSHLRHCARMDHFARRSRRSAARRQPHPRAIALRCRRKSLIVLQAALSLVLLVGAGLMTQTLRNLEKQNFGLTTANRYVLHFDPQGAGYTLATVGAFNEQLEREFSALPGVKSVGIALYSTLEGNNWGEGVYVEGRPAPGPGSAQRIVVGSCEPAFL